MASDTSEIIIVPLPQCKSKDLLENYWYIGADFYIYIDPFQKGETENAYRFGPIKGKIKSKTLSYRDKKYNSLIINDFYFNVRYHRVFKELPRHPPHKAILEIIMKKDTLTKTKSKFVPIFYFSFLFRCG